MINLFDFLAFRFLLLKTFLRQLHHHRAVVRVHGFFQDYGAFQAVFQALAHEIVVQSPALVVGSGVCSVAPP